jgi:carboxypeptidase C (cathepsin A)
MNIRNFKLSLSLLTMCMVLIFLVSLSKTAAANAGTGEPGDVKIEEDLVTEIPANILNTQMLKLDVKSYAGHINVPGKDPKGDYNTHLFYWFFESRNSQYVPEEKKKDIPLVIWLNGGPGGSSLLGLFLENGPFLIQDDDTGTIVPNPNSWNEDVHLLYWDQPVGTGFSYSVPKDRYAHSEKELSRQFYLAIQGFLDRHRKEKYRECPLYITGESYCGKYIPNMATEIMIQNGKLEKKEKDPGYINLKGLAIGDGWINPELQTKTQLDYAFQMGFVDTFQKQEIMKMYDKFSLLMRQKKMREASCWSNWILERTLDCGGNPDMYDVRGWTDVSADLLTRYLDQGTYKNNPNPTVKECLHVDDSVTWVTADDEGPVTEALVDDAMADAAHLLPALFKNYRVLMYTGNFDLICGFTGTEYILWNLDRFSADNQQEWVKGWLEKWRTLHRKVWVLPPNQTLGYIKHYENVTQVNIPRAGHLVPIAQPEVSRTMINKWIFKRPFPAYDPLEKKLKCCKYVKRDDCIK